MDPRQSVVFYGCNEDSSLGSTPFGRAIVSDITTQKALKDSDSFGLEIFKDEDLTQYIAILEVGPKVLADDLEPGSVYGMSVKPLIDTVQVSSLIKIEFTIEHQMY